MFNGLMTLLLVFATCVCEWEVGKFYGWRENSFPLKHCFNFQSSMP